jgi:hypothetical protein
MSKDADDFWSGLVDSHGRKLKSAQPKSEIVGGTTAQLFRTYARGSDYDDTSEPIPRLSRNVPAVDDVVIVQTLADGSKIILGKPYESGENEATFNLLQVRSDNAADTALFQIFDSDGMEVLNYRQDDDVVRLLRSTVLRLYNDDNSAINIALDPDIGGTNKGRITTHQLYVDEIDLWGLAVGPISAQYATSRWSGPEIAVPISGSGTLALIANRAYGVPWVAPMTGTLLTIGAEVTATAGTPIMRFAVYNTDNSGHPTTIVSAVGGINGNTNGVKTGSISAPVIAGNSYILTLGVSSALTIKSFTPGKTWFGQANAGGTDRVALVYYALAGGWTSFTDPWPSTTFTANDMPSISVRYS